MATTTPTGDLRFKRKYIEGMAPFEGGRPQMILQREMRGEDGTLSWEDVPVVEEGE